ncbi:DNA polymerase III subunit epsilon [Acetobacter oeni]|uniref:DNA polymerase III subunit epsilon n=1 Tax=Acetobacter oeni TaxID=304077 RepID=A0A511XKK7_9PROT|nr:DNA polymerase III subunit epsilon [Acetobacter oeni]MBB3881330.1 DNA polymerase-3 subunit epsilon [Acetobacter oeni]NHO18202.1 DNA polymerase III subunit epsilon [Acetobacter oeni]GBR11327.1 DNA polymerase III subunit epsilon [Acetobacter oeni LMG 21952]GEN63476.1 DNA polymerase III subunit epsilon [Acetobacter oeni]
MKRSVLFDTETTGLEATGGDRIIEIAALELLGDLPTGRAFHVLIDPERDVPPEAARVHGFTREDLEGKPKFAEIADDFLAFIGNDELIAHNATFDFGFINAELDRIGKPPLDDERKVDTLLLARDRFPGMPNNLDALCRRYGIDLSERTTHNALLDCKLLSEVYIELMGGRQHGLGLGGEDGEDTLQSVRYKRQETPRRPILIVPDETALAAHAAFVDAMKDPVWRR